MIGNGREVFVWDGDDGGRGPDAVSAFSARGDLARLLGKLMNPTTHYPVLQQR